MIYGFVGVLVGVAMAALVVVGQDASVAHAFRCLEFLCLGFVIGVLLFIARLDAKEP